MRQRSHTYTLGTFSLTQLVCLLNRTQDATTACSHNNLSVWLQVNAAVDDAAVMAEDVARLLSAARSKGKLTTAERKRAQALMISVAVSPTSRLHCAGHARTMRPFCYFPAISLRLGSPCLKGICEPLAFLQHMR